MCKSPEVRVCLGCTRHSKEPAAIAGASWALDSGESAAKPSSQQQRSLGKGLLPKPRWKGGFTLYEQCCPAPAPTRLLLNLPWSGWGQSGLDVGGELGTMAAAPQYPPGFKELPMTWFPVTCGARHRASLPLLPTPQGKLPSLAPHPRPPGDSQASKLVPGSPGPPSWASPKPQRVRECQEYDLRRVLIV